MDQGWDTFPQYKDALGKLTKIISEIDEAHGANKPTRVDVMVWADQEGGFRIAEITSIWEGTKSTSGASLMASDCNAGAMACLFAAERFVISQAMEPEEWVEDHYVFDFANETTWALIEVFGEGLTADQRNAIHTKFYVPRAAPTA